MRSWGRETSRVVGARAAGARSRELGSLELVVACLLVVASPLAAQTPYTTVDPPAVIPDNSGGVFSACQDITVPDAGTITDCEIETSLGHTWVGDLTYRLTSPNATVLTVMNRPGRVGSGFGNSADFDAATPIDFDDTAASAQSAEDLGEAPVGTGCGSATIVGADCGPGNYVPAPDAADTPIPGVGTNLADFNGESPTGVWELCVADSAGADTGTLTSWTLVITGIAQPEADLEVVKTGSAGAGQIVWTIQVTNNGPDNATGVVVTDTLDACTTYVSDDCGGANVPPWTWNIGALANGASVQCNVTVDSSGCAPGTVTNTATVAGNETDPNPGNDSGGASVGVGSVIEIPTLSDLGLLALVLLLVGAAWTMLRR